MKYTSVQVFQIKGLSSLEEGEVFSLTDDDFIDARAIICSNIDEYCKEIDKRKIIGNLILGGLGD